jgi:hypothetical protein
MAALDPKQSTSIAGQPSEFTGHRSLTRLAPSYQTQQLWGAEQRVADRPIKMNSPRNLTV